MVRDFDAEEGELEQHPSAVTSDGRVLEVLAGQHQLLGWHVTAADLAFLASIPAELDIDEYG